MSNSTIASKVRETISGLLDYYKKFDINRMFSVFTFTVAVYVLIIILCYAASFALTYFNPRTPYIESLDDIMDLFIRFSTLGTTFLLLTFALLWSFFRELSGTKKRHSISELLSSVSSKKWGLYFSFILISSLFYYFIPDPFAFEMPNYFDNYFLSDWISKSLHLILVVLSMFFSYVLIQKESFRFRKKEKSKLIAVLLVALGILMLMETFTSSFIYYACTILLNYIPVQLMMILTGILDLFIMSIGMTAIIMTLSHGEGSKLPTKGMVDELVDL